MDTACLHACQATRVCAVFWLQALLSFCRWAFHTPDERDAILHAHALVSVQAAATARMVQVSVSYGCRVLRGLYVAGRWHVYKSDCCLVLM